MLAAIEEAKKKLRATLRCLEEFRVSPIKTTIPFLRQVIAHPDFKAGNIDTGFVERELTLQATSKTP